MSGVFGGGSNGEQKKARAQARRQEQRANQQEQRARQTAERGSVGGRGRGLLVGRLSKVLPTNLGGVE